MITEATCISGPRRVRRESLVWRGGGLRVDAPLPRLASRRSLRATRGEGASAAYEGAKLEETKMEYHSMWHFNSLGEYVYCIEYFEWQIYYVS